MNHLFALLISLAPLSFAQTLNVFAASSLANTFEEIAIADELEQYFVDFVFLEEG
jgi:ABC-type molybdate transport system substrate-binding protein